MKMRISNLPHFKKQHFVFASLFILVLTSFTTVFFMTKTNLSDQIFSLTKTNSTLQSKLLSVQKQLYDLQSDDQYLKNKNLEDEIANIQKTYKKSMKTYENLQDLKVKEKDTNKFDTLMAQALSHLSEKNYASADAELADLDKQIQQENDKLAQAAAPQQTQNLPANNAPPGSGYSRQNVTSDVGTFTVDIIATDLNSSRVIVDTASDSDCHDNCPVLSLSDYVGRNGAFAGINGTYFCPTSYPSCAGKTNSFDLLVMNKSKHYFNSDNNVYSTNPAVIFSGNSARFVSQALQWGRDTGVDSVISNFPLLVLDNQIVYGGSGDPKFNSNGPRCFIGAKGNTAYIGIVNNATMNDSAHVIKTLGITSAMNLDEGGSTALWYGGYKQGPGRSIPNAVLFVRK